MYNKPLSAVKLLSWPELHVFSGMILSKPFIFRLAFHVSSKKQHFLQCHPHFFLRAFHIQQSWLKTSQQSANLQWRLILLAWVIFKFWRDHYGNHEVTLLSSQNNYIISDDVIHWVYSCGGRDHIKFIYLGHYGYPHRKRCNQRNWPNMVSKQEVVKLGGKHQVIT